MDWPPGAATRLARPCTLGRSLDLIRPFATVFSVCGLTRQSVDETVQCWWWISEYGALLEFYAQVFGENSVPSVISPITNSHMNPGHLSETPVTACLSCNMTQMFIFSASPKPDPGCTVYSETSANE